MEGVEYIKENNFSNNAILSSSSSSSSNVMTSSIMIIDKESKERSLKKNSRLESIHISHDTFPLIPENAFQTNEDENESIMDEKIHNHSPQEMITHENNNKKGFLSSASDNNIYSSSSIYQRSPPTFSNLISSNTEPNGPDTCHLSSYEQYIDKKYGVRPDSHLYYSYHKHSFTLTAPTSFNDAVEIKKDKLMATYVGKGRNASDVGILRSSAPWKITKRFGYYEVKVENASNKSQIYIGLADNNFIWNKNPGFYANSYAYRSDDGKKVSEKGSSEAFGPSFGTGHTIGCGLDFVTGSIFFTLNGKYLGIAFKNVKGIFSPTMSLHSTGECVTVNFGGEPFLFDLRTLELGENEKLKTEIRKVSLPPNAVSYSVFQYLLYQGYSDTIKAMGLDCWKTLAREDRQIQGLIGTLEARSSIRKLILEGNLSEAYKIIERVYSEYGDKTKYAIPKKILLPMKCQEWIELIRSNPTVEVAIEFLQNELIKIKELKLDSLEVDFLEKCVSVIAYEQPLKSPFHWLFNIEQRDRVADIVNANIVLLFIEHTEDSITQVSKLEVALRQLSVILKGSMQCQGKKIGSSDTFNYYHSPESSSHTKDYESSSEFNSITESKDIFLQESGIKESMSKSTNSPHYPLEGMEPFIKLLYSL